MMLRAFPVAFIRFLVRAVCLTHQSWFNLLDEWDADFWQPWGDLSPYPLVKTSTLYTAVIQSHASNLEWKPCERKNPASTTERTYNPRPALLLVELPRHSDFIQFKLCKINPGCCECWLVTHWPPVPPLHHSEMFVFVTTSNMLGW